MSVDTSAHTQDQGLWSGLYSDGLRLGVWTKYDKRTPQIFKEQGFAWLAEKRIWVGLRKWADDLIAALALLDPASFPREIGDAMLKKADQRREPFWSAAVRPALQTRGENKWFFMPPFDPATNRAMKKYNASWNSEEQCWMLTGVADDIFAYLDSIAIPVRNLTTVPADLPLRRQPGAWSPYLMHVSPEDEEASGVKRLHVGGVVQVPGAEKKGEEKEPDNPLYKPLELLPVGDDVIEDIAVRFSLLPHQNEGVRHFLQRTSALNADDMGLGKTRQTIAAASYLPGGKVIVCPASLKDNWSREIQMVLLDTEPFIFESALPETQPDWCIVNYERLDDFLTAMEKLDWHFSVMAVDEAHYLKEPTAQRTENAFALAEHADRKWLLTATPMLNTPMESWTLLRLSGHPAGDIQAREFSKAFTKTRGDRQGLGGRISEWMIRRMKDDVLTLAGKYRQEPVITISEVDRVSYDAFMDDDELMVLQKINLARQWLERVKREPILEMLGDLQPDAKAIIFCNFEKSVQWFMKQLPEGSAVRLTGKETRKQRDAAVQKFQNDPNCRWFVGNIKAAGVGLNLTAATYVFFVSRPWTPADQTQAEDRAYRIGQDRRVEIYIPIVADSIDEQIRSLLIDKQKVTEDVLVGALETKAAQAASEDAMVEEVFS